MARDFYAYMPILLRQFYEGISLEDGAVGAVLDGLLCSMDACEIAVLLQECDRLLAEGRSDGNLLQELWKLGARDFPAGPTRQTMERIRGEIAHRLELRQKH